MKKVLLMLITAAFMAICCSVLTTNNAYSQEPVEATKDKIKNIVKEYLQKNGDSGVKVIGLGSWISGGNYRDPLSLSYEKGTVFSDHDLRLFFPPDTPKSVAEKEWKAAREFIRERVKVQFGANADVILESINLYPPNQLTGSIYDKQSAKKAFQQMTVPPSLATDTVEDIEGLWAKEGKAFRQHYEMTKGRTFYKSEKGNIVGTFSDIEHMIEGRGIYTPEGQGKVAKEWIEHFYDEMAKADPDPKYLKKYIERIDETLNKGKDLCRVKHNSQYIQGLINQLDAMKPGDAITPELQRSINQVIREAKIDIELLEQVPNLTSAQKLEMMYALFDGQSSSWGRVRKVLSTFAEEVPLDTLITGIFTAFDAYQTSDLYAKGNSEGALRKAFETAVSSVSFAPGILAMITNAIIDDAKANGFIFVAATQDCEDLLQGYCGSMGRGGILEQATNLSIDSIINNQMPSNDKEFQDIISNIVRNLARRCSDRGFGTVTKTLSDSGVEEALDNYCINDLTKKWNIKRFQMMGQIAMAEMEIRSLIESGSLGLYYSPDPVTIDSGKANIDVYAEYNADLNKISSKFKAMSEKFKKISGSSYISTQRYYVWFLDGKQVSKVKSSYFNSGDFFEQDKASKTFSFDEASNHKISFKFGVEMKVVLSDRAIESKLLLDSIDKLRMDQAFAKDASINIAIKGDKPPTGTVKIIAPEQIDQNEDYIPARVELTGNLQGRDDIFIYWYVNDKNNLPYDFGESIEIENPRKESNITIYAEISNVCKPDKTSKNNKAIFKTLKCNPANNSLIKKQIFAADSKHIAITSKTQTASISQATNSKNWKKLLELYNSSQKPEEQEVIKNQLIEIAKDMNENNVKQLEMLKNIQAQNDAAIQPYKDKMKELCQGCQYKVPEDPARCKRCDNEWLCYGKALAKHEQESNLFKEAIYKVEDLVTYYKENFDPLYDSYYEQNDYKEINIAMDLSKPYKVIDYFNFCHDKDAVAELDNINIILKATKNPAKQSEEVTISTIINPMRDNYCDHQMALILDYTGEKIGENGESNVSVDYNSRQIKFIPNKIGTIPVKVKVHCDEANEKEDLGTATLDLIVNGGTDAIINGLENTVLFGTKKNLNIEILSEGSTDGLEVVWNSTPNVEFTPKTGKNTTVLFDRMQSPLQIWAEVNKPSGEMIARTQNYSVNIKAPEYKIDYQPKPIEAKVGQKVRATIVATPAIQNDTIDYRWVEPPDITTISNGVIEFVPTDENKPVKLHVIPRVPTYGEKVGNEIYDQYTPGKYKLIAEVVGPKTQYGVNEDIKLLATIYDIDPEQVDFEWNANSGSNFITGRTGSEVKINRNDPGECVATVTAFDKNNKQIAQAEISLTIGTAGELAQHKKKQDEKQKNSKESIDKAKQLTAEGKTEEAIELLKKAATNDPNNKELASEIRIADNKLKEKKILLSSLEMALNKELAVGGLDQAKKIIEQLEKNAPDSPQLLEAKNKLSSKMLEKAKMLVEQNKFDEAIKLLTESQKYYSGNNELNTYKNDIIAKLKTVDKEIENFNRLLAEDNYFEAKAILDKLITDYSGYQPVTDANTKLTMAKNKFIEKASQKVNQAKELFAQGDIDKAITLLEEAAQMDSKNTMAQNFMIEYKAQKRVALEFTERINKYYSQNNFIQAKVEADEAIHQKINTNYPPLKDAISKTNLALQKEKEAEIVNKQNQSLPNNSKSNTSTSTQSWGGLKQNSHSALTANNMPQSKTGTKTTTSSQSWGGVKSGSYSTTIASTQKNQTSGNSNSSTSGQSWGSASKSNTSNNSQSWGSAKTEPDVNTKDVHMTITTKPDGTVITESSDGTTLIQHPDGREEFITASNNSQQLNSTSNNKYQAKPYDQQPKSTTNNIPAKTDPKLLQQYVASQQKNNNTSPVKPEPTLQQPPKKALIDTLNYYNWPEVEAVMKTLAQKNQFDELISILKRGEQVNPKEKEFYDAQSGIYMLLGKDNLAVSALRRGIAILPSTSGEFNMGIKVISDPSQNNLKQMVINKIKADLGISGNIANANQQIDAHFNKAVEYITTAQKYCEQGNFKAALQYLGEAKAIMPIEMAELYLYYGLIYYQLHDYNQAKYNLNKAKQIDPALSNQVNSFLQRM